ncbi:hypothetical protein HPB50_004296 [Hyalomma asiaticum]|uniref:Uncharacterized protein n=1 Tax=Hyalomma asiaticum TaxID=266040 RepID=A0ACB7RYK3_HYAAI|nr:hypothetical protein HPB50_004296 [Hyalomma asiaticum]
MARKRVKSVPEVSNKKVECTNDDVELQEKDMVLEEESDASMSAPEHVLDDILYVLSEKIQQTEECLVNVEDTLDRNIYGFGPAAEEFLLTAKTFLEEKMNTSLELVCEVNGALRDIAEVNKI